MRQKWAKFIAFLSGLLVLLLSVIFAIMQNQVELFDSARQKPVLVNELQKTVASDNLLIEKGRKVYQQQACMRCHSIAGKGNPRNSLDGVGIRLSADELRNMITGENVHGSKMPGYVTELKKEYARLPEIELDALLAYMQSLRL